jgi:hypothetical protein
MSKKKGLNSIEFAAVLKPEHRAHPGTEAHLRDAFTLLSLHQRAPNGEGRWPWARQGKQEMDIQVDADGLWRIVKALA